MKQWFTKREREMVEFSKEALDKIRGEAIGLPKEPLVVPMPAAPPSATTIGALVVMLDRSYQSYQTRRTTLEAEIAERTEALRQVNTALSSLGAALLAAADDPVLTDDERAAAEGAGQVQMDEALGGLDLSEA